MGNIWEGANLDVKNLRELRVLFEANDKPAFERKVLSVMKTQNPPLPVDKWKILRVGSLIPNRERVLVTLRIDGGSKSIENNSSIISYGVRGFKVNITRNSNAEFNERAENELIEQLVENLVVDGNEADSRKRMQKVSLTINSTYMSLNTSKCSGVKPTKLRFVQINLQQPINAIENLLILMNSNNIDIGFIQEL